MRKGELNLGVVVLLGAGSLGVLGLDDGGPDDLNRLLAGRVSTSHVVVEGLHSIHQLGGSELLVHVVCAGPTVVSQPNAVVLHHIRALLVNLIHAQDLACGLLHLGVLVQEVPESGTSYNLVGCKQVHLEQLRGWVYFSGCLTAYDLEVTDLGGLACVCVCVVRRVGGSIHGVSISLPLERRRERRPPRARATLLPLPPMNGLSQKSRSQAYAHASHRA